MEVTTLVGNWGPEFARKRCLAFGGNMGQWHSKKGQRERERRGKET